MNQLCTKPLYRMLALSIAAGLWFGACGGEENIPVLGIYQVISHTENKNGCSAEGGPATMDTAPFFFVRKDQFASISYHSVMGCKSLEECRVGAKDSEFLSSFNFIFDGRKDASTLTGNTRFTGFGGLSKTCTKPSVTDRTFVRTGDDVRIEARTRIGDDYPADSKGFCTTELGEKASRDKPCSEFVVVTAKYVEPLPQ